MTYVSLIGMLALVGSLRYRHARGAEGRTRDATRVNLNFLLGGILVLFPGQILIDVFRP
jgi:hypothetical protein